MLVGLFRSATPLLVATAVLSAPALAQIVAQDAYIKASNPGFGDQYAEDLAFSGDTLIVAARLEGSDGVGVNGTQNNNNAPGSGAAYVYVRSGSSWSQQAFLKSPVSSPGDWFSHDVAISGDVAVVSANQHGVGAAFVYRRTGTSWAFEDTLTASNLDLHDGFGIALAIAGDTIVVGAHGEKSNATGINGDDSDNSLLLAGAAYVFVRTGTTWSQQAYIKASNTGAEDQFGVAVAAFGDTLVVGAPREDSAASGIDGNQMSESAPNSGAAYVFTRTGTTWSQQAYIKASNAGGADAFGSNLELHGETLVVGANGEMSSAGGVNGDQSDNSVQLAGAAYVFERTAGVWSQQAYLKASNPNSCRAFGQSVAVFGDLVAIGAPEEFNNSRGVNGNQSAGNLKSSGAAYVFRRAGTAWSQAAYLKASNSNTQRQYGAAIALSGERVVVGDWDESGGSSGINGDQFSSGAFRSGAAYVYNLNAVLPTNEPGTSFCNGDGGDQLGCVNCPCMNNAAQGTVGGCLNSAASSARLHVTGDASVSLHHAAFTDLRFSVTGSKPNALNILNSGDGLAPTNPANPCFGVSFGAQALLFDGLRCAVMNTRRHGGRVSDGAGDVGVTNGPWGGEFNPQPGIANAGTGFISGQTRYFQAIYRDDASLSCMRGLNTSQAIEITFAP